MRVGERLAPNSASHVALACISGVGPPELMSLSHAQEVLVGHQQGMQSPRWLAQEHCLLAPIYDFFLLRNIRKTFALTLNPPPHVTVIAGPGGKKVSLQFGANQP